MVHHEGVTSGLQCELETRQHELCDKKVTIEALTKEVHTWKKELEMKKQEVLSARIEASNLIRYSTMPLNPVCNLHAISVKKKKQLS